MSSYKPIDVSKEDYRKFLERSGFLDAMTKVLIKCNAARPENVIEFVIENLSSPTRDSKTVANLKGELESAHEEIQRLKNEINSIKGGHTVKEEHAEPDMSSSSGPETTPQNIGELEADSCTSDTYQTAKAEDGISTSAEQIAENMAKATIVPKNESKTGSSTEKPDEEKAGAATN